MSLVTELKAKPSQTARTEVLDYLRNACILWALACTFLVLFWQHATVNYNYSGNASALYCTGALLNVPASLESERIYRFPNSNGWDGQFYHYIAHDPLLQRDMWRYIDAPRLRYRRILVPFLAYTLAVGQSEHVDMAYRGVILLCFLLGAYSLGRFAVSQGRHAAWGLAFFLIPASVISIDRLAVDVSLIALCLAFAVALQLKRKSWEIYAILLLAGLSRDTGLLLIAAFCIWLLRQKRFATSAVFATAAVPTVAWYGFVTLKTAPYVHDGSLALPLTGALDRILHPMQYPFAPMLNAVIESLDFLAVLGILLAFALAWKAAKATGFSPIGITMLLFVALGLFVWRPADWLEAYDYGRILSPLLVLLAIQAFQPGRWVALLPICMIIPRFGLQMGPQLVGILKGLLS